MDLLQYLLAPSRPTTNNAVPVPLQPIQAAREDSVLPPARTHYDAPLDVLKELCVPSVSNSTTSIPTVVNEANSDRGGTVQAHDEGDAAPINPASGKICHFWYHYRECKRKDDTVCPFRHSMPPDGETVSVQKVPRKLHWSRCELEHCPWAKKQDRPKKVATNKLPKPAATGRRVCMRMMRSRRGLQKSTRKPKSARGI